MVDESRVTGAARDAFGRVQEAAGNLTGDSRTQARGMYNQAHGQAENALGQLSDCIREQPLTSVLIGAGIGYVLGRMKIL
ncbi:CsbD family protein [Roseomonas marmotae]|uniref:CsbD family protein n=1 Tax=Roseomonas marmotae TaxID=2768161 RepID=A0ABS3K9E1_9PROT|nr:CsbD family protein [Roseomonas marmotae]MBO1074080.1 CsbD family protein [Roseomonas marmotae]QTI78865.1 CsbD family protein [Roseomonas marmotae]